MPGECDGRLFLASRPASSVFSFRANAAVPAPYPLWKHIGSVARCIPAGGFPFLYQRCGSMSFSYGASKRRTKAALSGTSWYSAAPKPLETHWDGFPRVREPPFSMSRGSLALFVHTTDSRRCGDGRRRRGSRGLRWAFFCAGGAAFLQDGFPWA